MEPAENADDDAPWPIYFGREMRGGLRGGHSHISYSSTPVLKRKGTWGDCPACVEWAKELSLNDGDAGGRIKAPTTDAPERIDGSMPPQPEDL